MSPSLEQNPAATPETDLIWKLRHGSDADRFEAVEEVRDALGAQALEPLCDALRDPCVRVRIEAALALGDLHDAGAVEPLLAALRGTISGGQAAWQVRKSLLLVAIWLLIWNGVLYLKVLADPAARGWMSGFTIALAAVPWDYLAGRRAASRFAAAVSLALAEIAEHQVTPELHGLAKELRLLATDRVQQDRMTRNLIREAAHRLEEATAEYRDLPFASTPALAGGADRLPRTAALPADNEASLPRV